MGLFSKKYCALCGTVVDKRNSPQRFGKYFCSESHANDYTKQNNGSDGNKPKKQKSSGGCC